MSAAGDAFLQAEVRYQDTGSAEIAYRKYGAGDPLLLVHGWPLAGFTFRHIIPELAKRYTCYAIDLPGAGDTRWTEATDFSFKGQAANVAAFLERAGIGPCHVVAHDTGATIARQLALIAPQRVRSLVLIGTEIPGHRPPWIPLYQHVTALPGSGLSFRLLLRSKTFLYSPLAFGNVFANKALLTGDFDTQFIQPLIASARRMDGQIRYLRGIDWELVDSLAEGHKRIDKPVLLVWGAQDVTFPVERAKPMASQFPQCRGFRVIDGAKLLVHEEKPVETVAAILEFVG